MDLALLDSRLAVALVSTGLGAFLMFLMQMIVNRRGLFTYLVWHNKVGTSTDDAVFGTVRVTWNHNLIHNLYLSVIELKNESQKDYENVVVKIFTNDTDLLSERSEIVGTTRFLDWTEEYSNRLAVATGAEPTQDQVTLYSMQREYLLPTMNRGQVVRVAYLNAAHTEHEPTLGMDIVHKGVQTKLRVPQNVFMGVSQPQAALVGSALGLGVISAVIVFVDAVWMASVICMMYGLLVVVPGAICIKSWRWFRGWLGG